MKKAIITGTVLVLMLFLLPSCVSGVSQHEYESLRSEYESLRSEYDRLQSRYDALEAELRAPQAKVQIREMHFEWGEGNKGKIVGEVKNYGKVDAINVFVGVTKYKGEHGGGWDDFFWVDYLRAGENKRFELKVSKPYCEDEWIPQIELGFNTVGEYGREWKSKVMNR